MKLGRESQKQTYGDQGIRGEGGINQEVGDHIYILLFIKQITNEDCCVAQGALLSTLE